MWPLKAPVVPPEPKVETIQPEPIEPSIKEKLLELDRLKVKINMYQDEIIQYVADLDMWTASHGVDYPARRKKELLLKVKEIESI